MDSECAKTPGQYEVIKEHDASDVFRSHLNEFAYTSKTSRMASLSAELLSCGERPDDFKTTADKTAFDLFQNALKAEIASLPEGERKAFCTDAHKAASEIVALASASESVRQSVRANDYRAAEEQQRKLVTQSDRIPTRQLELEARAVQYALKNSGSEDVKVRLREMQEAIQNALAVPFTERFRLAAIQLHQSKLTDAEMTLDGAFARSVKPMSLENKSIQHLVQYADAEKRYLETTRSVPKFVQTHFSSLAGRDRYLSKSELSSSLAQSTFSPLERRVINFMLSNYDKLIDMKNDGFIANSKGISNGDLNEYWSKTRPYDFK